MGRCEHTALLSLHSPSSWKLEILNASALSWARLVHSSQTRKEP